MPQRRPTTKRTQKAVAPKNSTAKQTSPPTPAPVSVAESAADDQSDNKSFDSSCLKDYLPGLSPLGSCTASLNRDIDAVSINRPEGYGTVMCLVSVAGSNSSVAGKLSIEPNASALITSFDAPFAVVSVAGLSRTGKSFLLNQLAGQSSGFDIGASIQPKTQGLWMCALDCETLKSRGLPSKYPTLFIDTEGTGSFARTETYDAKIFALACLMSSMLVYNTMGTIDEGAIQSLATAASLARTLRVDTLSSSPSLLWVLRDFALQLQLADKRNLSPDAYLEHVLSTTQNEASAGESSVNDAHIDIRKMFPQRSCVTLPRPVNDEDDLARLDTIARADLRPEYLQNLDVLLKHAHNNMIPKSIDSIPLNGEMLMNLLSTYIEALNSEKTPELESTWANILNEQTRVAKAEAIAAFEHRMVQYTEKNTPANCAELLSNHTDALGTAETTFLRSLPTLAVNETEAAARALAEIRAAAKAYTQRVYVPKLASVDETKNKEIFEKCFTEALESADTCEKLVENVKSASIAYDQQASAASSRYEVVYRSGVLTRVALRACALNDAAIAVCKSKLNETAAKEIESIRKELVLAQEMHLSVNSEWQSEQKKCVELRSAMETLQAQIKEQKTTIRNNENNLAEADAHKAKLETQILALENAVTERTLEISVIEGRSSAERQELESKLENARKECTIAESARSVASADSQKLDSELDTLRKARLELEGRIADLECRLAAAAAKEIELKKALEDMKAHEEQKTQHERKKSTESFEKIRNLEKELAKSKDQLSEKTQDSEQLAKLKKEVSEKDAAIQKLTGDVQNIKAECEAAKSINQSTKAVSAEQTAEIKKLKIEAEKAKEGHATAMQELTVKLKELEKAAAEATKRSQASCNCAIM